MLGAGALFCLPDLLRKDCFAWSTNVICMVFTLHFSLMRIARALMIQISPHLVALTLIPIFNTPFPVMEALSLISIKDIEWPVS